MADREFYPDGGTIGHKRVRVNFSFNTNGSSNPNTSLTFGASDLVSTINITNAGEYTVTCSPRDAYNRVLGAKAQVEDTSTGAGTSAEIGAFSNEGTSTALTFKVFTYNSSKALTNLTNTRVFVELVLRNTAASGIP